MFQGLWYSVYMKTSTIIYCTFAILFGVFFFVYGGYDDSPGAQGIGAIAVVLGIRGFIKGRKKNS